MLYILRLGNHPELTYQGGQEPMVHIMADLRTTVAWAEAKDRRWAFTNGNAGTRYTDFHDDLNDLDSINWDAVKARDFRDPVVKEGKQAEFLLHEYFPWDLIEEVGVRNREVKSQVLVAVEAADHQPEIRVQRAWYY